MVGKESQKKNRQQGNKILEWKLYKEFTGDEKEDFILIIRYGRK